MDLSRQYARITELLYPAFPTTFSQTYDTSKYLSGMRKKIKATVFNWTEAG